MRALATYGLNLDDLRSTIANANVNTPKGTLDGPSTAYAISANDQLQSAAEFANLVIAYRNGNPVRLADVAATIEGAENTSLSAWSDLSPAIILNIQRQPGANVVKVADTILALLPSLQAALPAGVDLAILTDRTTTIRASVNDVQFELILSLGLVVLVIFVFLRSIPATVIPSLSMPLSIIGSFGVMYLLGYSLNNLSLMALTIATGFVVDDAIVMIENIARYVEAGETLLEAALKGAHQIGFTILSLTLSLIAVLIPLLFMGDLIGRLFREFAMTLVVTILISAVVSLMTTLVALISAMPLAFGGGEGAEIRRPLGLAIIGRLIVSQILTLYTTPIVYLYLNRLHRWRRPVRNVNEDLRYGKGRSIQQIARGLAKLLSRLLLT